MKKILFLMVFIGFSLVAFSQETSYVCDTTSKTLTASVSGGVGTITYSWSGPGGTTSGATRNVTATGEYTWTATDSLGCTATGTHEVIYEPNPTDSITINANDYCLNSGQTISATGVPSGYTYSWSFGSGSSPSSSTESSVSVSYTTPGTKTITLTIQKTFTGSDNGCSATCEWTVTKNITIGQLTGTSSCG